MTNQASKIGNIMLTNWRIAFAHGLWTASQVQGQGRPAFSSSFIAPPNHPDMAKFQETLLAVAQAKWGAEGAQVLQALVAGGRICIRDGNSKPDVAGYPGNLFISARSPTRPLVIDQNRQPLDQSSGKPYSGCYVNARLNIWAQQNQHGRRINAQLAGVQFVKDGEPFAAGGSADADEFGEVESAAQAGNEFGDLFGGNTPAQQQPNQLLPPVTPQPATGQEFDYTAGLPTQVGKVAPQFDPNTGLPIAPAPRFDPNTGQPI